jgi:hypothetical protein
MLDTGYRILDSIRHPESEFDQFTTLHDKPQEKPVIPKRAVGHRKIGIIPPWWESRRIHPVRNPPVYHSSAE